MIKNLFLVLISDLDEMLSSLGVAPVSEVLSSLSSVNSMTSDNSANATPDGSLQPASLNNGTRYENDQRSAVLIVHIFNHTKKNDVMMIPIFVLIAVREQANDRQLVLVLCQCRQLRFHLRKQSRTRNKHKQLTLVALSVMVGTFIILIFLLGVSENPIYQIFYKIYVSNTSLPKTAFKNSISFRFSLRFNIGIFVSHDNLIF